MFHLPRSRILSHLPHSRISFLLRHSACCVHIRSMNIVPLTPFSNIVPSPQLHAVMFTYGPRQDPRSTLPPLRFFYAPLQHSKVCRLYESSRYVRAVYSATSALMFTSTVHDRIHDQPFNVHDSFPLHCKDPSLTRCSALHWGQQTFLLPSSHKCFLRYGVCQYGWIDHFPFWSQ